jgi:hypothetical protein
MKLSIGILVLAMAGTIYGQNSTVIQKTQDHVKASEHASVPAKATPKTSHPVSARRDPAKALKPSSVHRSANRGNSNVHAVRSEHVAAIAKGKVSKDKIAVAAAHAPKHKAPVARNPHTAVHLIKPKTPIAVKTTRAGTAAVALTKKVKDNHKVNAAKVERNTVDVETAKKSDDDVLKSADTERKINLTGRRDPFLSPVVAQSVSGSGCSTGKRCLSIDEISLKGVVKSDNGMIAVVVNSLNKAYFLHENDPVFNGYVLRITGDSIVFSETIQDKFGKPLTREVTKRIFTPAV